MIKHPSLCLLSHNFDRRDLFTVVFCTVDDWMQQTFGNSNAPRQHRGPRSDEFADSEVMTVLLVAELCHCQRERAWLRQVRASYHDLFPALPENSRFWRRAQQVRYLLGQLRQAILFWADADLEPARLMDTFPMPLCACYRIQQSSQPITGSCFAYNSSKKQYYFGLHPAVLMTASGYIDDIILAPGYCGDVPLLAEYLNECLCRGIDISFQDWLMDKGFYSKPLAKVAQEVLGVNLLARKRDYAKQLDGLPPVFWQILIDKVRKPIESVIANLTQCFGVEHMLVRSDWGLFRRMQAKATAFSLARYFNQGLERDPMNIAHYAV